MRDERAVAHEDDGGDATSLDGLVATSIDFAGLVVDPFALRQIDLTAVAGFHQRGHKHLGTEHILILNIPGTRVVGKLQKEGTHHRQSSLGAVLRLCIDVGHQLVFHLSTRTESIGE